MNLVLVVILVRFSGDFRHPLVGMLIGFLVFYKSSCLHCISEFSDFSDIVCNVGGFCGSSSILPVNWSKNFILVDILMDFVKYSSSKSLYW